MSYFKPIDKIKENANKALTADNIRREASIIMTQTQEEKKRRESAVSSLKDLLPFYSDLQQKAYIDKDRLAYIYATGALFFFDNFNVITEEMEVYEIEMITNFFNQSKDQITEDNLLRLKQLCYYHHKADIRTFRVHPNVECTNYTIGDLIGMGIRLINYPDKMSEYNLFK